MTRPLTLSVLALCTTALLGACSATGATSASIDRPAAPAATAGGTSGSLTAGPTTTSATQTGGTPASTVTVTTPASTRTVTATARTTVTTSTDVRVVSNTSGFVTPSGRIACIMVAPGEYPAPPSLWARCDYLDADHAWTAPKPEPCDWSWGNTLFLYSTATSGCVSEAAYPAASLASTNASYTAWWRSGEPTVSRYGDTMAALSYGSSIQAGDVRCTSETVGVTCTNRGTGHGFFISQASYRFF